MTGVDQTRGTQSSRQGGSLADDAQIIEDVNDGVDPISK